MKNNSSAFVNQVMVCALVTICFGGSIGLGTVWLRYQISNTAKVNNRLAAQIADLQRHIDEQAAQIESEQRPDELRRKNAGLAIGFVPLNDIPVEQVTENTVQRLSERMNRELFNDRAAPTAPPITFKLAQH